MARGGSIQLLRVFGIRIGVDTSWFVVLFLFIFLLSGSFRNALDGSQTEAYLTAVASALSFFGSLVLHELGHALVARRLGIGISGIDLWFFGGIAKMERDTDSPGNEFKVAIAGPVVTLLVVAACVGLGLLLAGGSDFWHAATLDGGATVTPALLLLSWLATINVALFLFNMVPAFPLDGGRIARALVWKLTGDRGRATRAAAGVGQGFSYLLAGLGIALVLMGSLANGLWLIVLGMFLGQAARGAVLQSAFTDRIEGVTVADVMDREPVAIPAGLPVQRAHDEYFLRYGWPWFPVVDHDGRFIGLARREQVDGAVAASHWALTVREVMDADAESWRIRQDEPLEALLGSAGLRRLGALIAVDANGTLRGVVTLDQVRRALQSAGLPA